jgi:hypothetical protein
LLSFVSISVSVLNADVAAVLLAAEDPVSREAYGKACRDAKERAQGGGTQRILALA